MTQEDTPSDGVPPDPPPAVPKGRPPPPPRRPIPGGETAPVASTDAGRIVGGVVTAVVVDEVDLMLDDGRSAVIHRRNFDDSGIDPTTLLNVGDRAEGAILARDDAKGRVVLSRSWALKKQAWDTIARISAEHGQIEGVVTATSKSGVVVDVGVRGFVPTSHLELEPPTDLAAYVGQKLELKVLEVDQSKERLVLSRRSLLMKQQRKATHDLLAALEVGETRRGVVSSLTDYGAFVDLGGVNGLVHLSELSWSRLQHPKDVVSVGDEVDVKVLDVKVKKRRVGLSIRQLEADPLDQLTVGEVVTGPVTRLVDFGAFVDVGVGEGLVHVSELSEYRVAAPEEVVTPGEEVRVVVLGVDKRRRRIELSIRKAVSGDFD